MSLENGCLLLSLLAKLGRNWRQREAENLVFICVLKKEEYEETLDFVKECMQIHTNESISLEY